MNKEPRALPQILGHDLELSVLLAKDGVLSCGRFWGKSNVI